MERGFAEADAILTLRRIPRVLFFVTKTEKNAERKKLRKQETHQKHGNVKPTGIHGKHERERERDGEMEAPTPKF